MTALTDKQLAAQVAGWRRKLKKENPRCFGVKTELPYAGSEQIAVDGETFRVTACRSDLEAREWLAADKPDAPGSVLLFTLDQSKLGDDLIARFAARRLLPVDPTSTVRELFGVHAHGLDPRIAENRPVIEALLRLASQGSPPPAPAGVLEADFAWSVLLGQPDLLRQGFGLSDLLRLSLDPAQWAAIERLEAPVQRALFDWMADRDGEAPRVIGRAVAEGGTAAELLLPIGLCLGPLFDPGSSAPEKDRATALGRLEPYLAGQTMDAATAGVWHRAALDAIRGQPLGQMRALAHRVDDLLKALKADAIAVETHLSIAGLEARFQSFAEALAGFLRRKGLNGLEALTGALKALQTHGLAKLKEASGRLAQAETARRLAVWIKQTEVGSFPPLPSTLGEAMRHYIDASAYVDRAIIHLTDADERSDLDKAYAKLRKLAEARRVEEQRHFARTLADWSSGKTRERVLCLEEVVAHTVAPLAKERGVLLLVLDGMSAAVFHELLEDFRDRAWQTLGTGDRIGPALAVLPSVTAISRKALFSGTVDHSDRRSEAAAFREHPALAALSPQGKPQLFLKGDLSEPGSPGLSPKIREALENKSPRVLSILLNVVDDQLGASDQLKVEWRIDRIRYLAQILESAALGGRVIVLTSDHGNVLELNQTHRVGEFSNVGDRYRDAGALLDESNEILLSGPRIEQATGHPSVMVAATDRIRYGSKKPGYHGGCADMEGVVPVAILLPETETPPPGWDFIDVNAPAWWSAPEEESLSPEKPIRRPAKPAPAKKTEDDTMELPFPELEAPDVRPWISALCTSAVFHQQMEALGKTPVKREQVERFLAVLEERKGSTALTVLAAAMEMNSMRLRGLIVHLRRLFNVDGYEIVAQEAETGRVSFDKALALKQFGVKV